MKASFSVVRVAGKILVQSFMAATPKAIAGKTLISNNKEIYLTGST
jgi:hypothetical protein